MNIVWAIKNMRRGRQDRADLYFSAACDKLDLPQAGYDEGSLARIFLALESRGDMDARFLRLVKAECG